MLLLRKLCLSLTLLALAHQVWGQIHAIPIGELTDSIRLRPRPSLVLISTSWCMYCRMQKAQLKMNTDFQTASTRFYFSELDAETKENIIFNDATYAFQRTGVDIGTHELAYALGNIDGQLAFPTWVLIDENFTVLFTYPGVLDKPTLTKLVTYLSQQPAETQ